MKKLYSSLLLLFPISLFAQPTFTANQIVPEIGDSYVIFQADPAGFNPGNAGADRSWDFSGLSEGTQTQLTVVDPSTSQNEANFPLADVMVRDAGREYFLQSVNDSLILRGYADSLSATQFAVIFAINDYNQTPATLMTFPVTFQDNASTSLAYNYTEYQPGDNFGQQRPVEGTFTSEADAYGEMTLPDGTVLSEVMRFKYTENIDWLQNGNVLGSFEITTFEWREAYTKVPVMRYETISLDNTVYNSKLTYMSGAATGIQNKVVKSYKMYPNPAQDVIFINQDGNDFVSVQIIDMTGKLIIHQGVSQMGDLTQINISKLPRGVYSIGLQRINGEVAFDKFVKN